MSGVNTPVQRVICGRCARDVVVDAAASDPCCSNCGAPARVEWALDQVWGNPRQLVARPFPLVSLMLLLVFLFGAAGASIFYFLTNTDATVFVPLATILFAVGALCITIALPLVLGREVRIHRVLHGGHLAVGRIEALEEREDDYRLTLSVQLPGRLPYQALTTCPFGSNDGLPPIDMRQVGRLVPVRVDPGNPSFVLADFFPLIERRNPQLRTRGSDARERANQRRL